MKKRLLQLCEQESRSDLEVDTTLSAKGAGLVSTSLTIVILLLSPTPLTLTFGHQLILTTLMLFSLVLLLFLGVGYGRYRSTRTFWEYLLSLKHTPPTHWTVPFKLTNADNTLGTVCARWLFLLTLRCCPSQRPKHKAPILLFQQAALLLAP